MRALIAMILGMLPLAAAAQEPSAAQRPLVRITGEYAALTDRTVTAEVRTAVTAWLTRTFAAIK